jgi:hypothetical protein
MVDDRPEDIGPSPDLGRAKRAPPTIDLEASEASSETQGADGAAPVEPTPQEPMPKEPKPRESKPREPTAAVSPWVVSVISGAVAASLVIGVGWVLGWPPVQPPGAAAPQVSVASFDDLAARVAGVESRINRPAAVVPDPAAAARLETLEKSLASLRGDLAAARVQSDKLAAAINDVKTTPREPTAALDLSGINERIAGIERVARAQSSEIAQENAKPADDMPLRRIVAAALLDVLVRIGDPYPAALAAAKSLSADAAALKPLDGFAASGVPSPASLSRDLLTLVPKLMPPAAENATTATGIVDRLQAGAAKLVRIERTDTVGDSHGAIVARITAAGVRNDFNEARRELKTLAPADRAAAQGWIDRADARDAALAASRNFAAEAMAALVKPAP